MAVTVQARLQLGTLRLARGPIRLQSTAFKRVHKPICPPLATPSLQAPSRAHAGLKTLTPALPRNLGTTQKAVICLRFCKNNEIHIVRSRRCEINPTCETGGLLSSNAVKTGAVSTSVRAHRFSSGIGAIRSGKKEQPPMVGQLAAPEKPKKYTKSNLPEKVCIVCNRPFNW
jgi:hypothetical protein